MTVTEPIFGDILARLISNDIDVVKAVEECETAHRDELKNLIKAIMQPADPRNREAQALYQELVKEIAAGK